MEHSSARGVLMLRTVNITARALQGGWNEWVNGGREDRNGIQELCNDECRMTIDDYALCNSR